LKESFPTLKMLKPINLRKWKKMRGCSLSGLLVLSFRGISTLKCADQSNKGDFSKIKHYQKWALGSDVFLYTMASKTAKTETHQASDSEKLCLLSLLSAWWHHGKSGGALFNISWLRGTSMYKKGMKNQTAKRHFQKLAYTLQCLLRFIVV